MVHEVLHASRECYNGDMNTEDGELLIGYPTLTRLTHGIYQLLRDNPEFVAAILGGATSASKP